ncbi:mitochondrial carrier protein, putative [Plasmodium knowlesi strain H]|uniref:Mitochondrial carrier protein, putative n=3 Tax=Plasmodium knowlesi TaxID=5850 RepID=A0A5K1UE06_PLAKH|nr:mitochondrial carrier protein, putative [Plasmodium knowlesi strain H]OTN64680.1 putative Mitochondrial carrier protein [Plasmodium knowlesi]CAA9988854.1 mitochondrial carrier protein, putative [Plasmodium knowlesi strain H]SBO24683.1 mitochondrial carrier protein, putative [Plasmodium knowlesi strain H]SBO27963.1 mitochondrial carrier protein, putative [Plasmodium knowlesi strain H]VVS78328.1 mitochondrial carrier protein, putative [Plasmodium knowlesi strain H]|eukprot:XP_002261200.1 mitochondrial carrier protein, putative [Plasmodium knowlesi strain H]
MESELKNEEQKKRNKKKILLCGLVSGIVTKTLFAPMDRIKLFYQIQPMFNQYSKEKSKDDLKGKKKKRIKSRSLLLTGVDQSSSIQSGMTESVSKRKRYAHNENVHLRNLKNTINQIIHNSIKKKKKKKIINTSVKYAQLCRHYDHAKYSSPHQVFKKIFHTYYQNRTNINNANNNYSLLNINTNVKHALRSRSIFFSRTTLSPSHPVKYQSIIQSFLFIIKEEGILGLWKGNLINTIRGGIVYSAKFGTNDLIKEKYKKKKKDDSPAVEVFPKGLPKKNDAKSNSQKMQKNFNYYESVIAGYASGIIQKTISYPLDLLSIRVALGINEKYLRNNSSMFNKKKSILGIIREINSNEGFAGFFKGYLPTLLTGVPYVTLQMLFFDFYKNIFENYFPHKSNSLSSVAMYSSMAGSLSNLSSLIIVFPGDTVRKRMMNNGIDNKNYIYKNTIHCIKNIYHCEGVRNFYYGLFPSMLKSIPSGAIQFMSYEILKHMLSQA